VLFVVAADDGVMPQTEEHLDILHLLGVEQAIFVITKTDLVNEARLHEVAEEIRMLTGGTTLERSAILPFSFVTGEGLPELREAIVQRLRSSRQRRSRSSFRLPVDRAFSLQGHGLIVTGTAVSGEIRVGDRVRSLPRGDSFRVRSVQVHDEQVAVGAAGQRVALNLSGPERHALERGDVVVHESLTRTSVRFDAHVEVRPSAAAGIKNHQRIRVHVGTAERMGKLIVLGPEERIGPKQTAYCQVALADPVHVLRRDRFVIRDETAQRTLAGGVVVHPWPGKHRKSDSRLEQTLRVFHEGDRVDIVNSYVADSDDFAISADDLAQFLDVHHEELEASLAQVTTIRSFRFEEGTLYTSEERWQRFERDALGALAEFHRGHPLARGMDVEDLRARMPYRIAPRLFRACVERLDTQGRLVRDGSLLRLAGHDAQPGAREQELVQRIVLLLSRNPLAPPDVRQLETETGRPRTSVMEVLGAMERQRTLVRVSPDLYFLADAITRVKSATRECLLKNNELTPAGFRDLLGTSRKYSIPLLEYLDREGITIRVGDVRRLKSQPANTP
jgi:selenocysteine-specific elongation factor